jgi:dolichol-phosphate mannosyltransferase
MRLSVIIPTRNEAANIPSLLQRIETACHGLDAEVIFVDDSTDCTYETITQAAAESRTNIRLVHHPAPVAGLSGAVVEGLSLSAADYCVVMGGDLQHPPELIPELLAELEATGSDIVSASRYSGPQGRTPAHASWHRRNVSTGARLLAKSLFPGRLGRCSDPLTGFFALRRAAVDYSRLQPCGFKILMEILARHRLAHAEIPLVYGGRTPGQSKATLATGLLFILQLGELRFGKAGLFAAVGALGAVLNLAIMALMLSGGANYLAAAVVAAELTIISNFLMQEKIVFGRVPLKVNGRRMRFFQSFGFNNVEALFRMPVLLVAVDVLWVHPIVAQAATLLGAFVLRYLFHAKIVYSSGTARTSERIRARAATSTEVSPRPQPGLGVPGNS